MAQIATMEFQTELKSPAHKYFEVFASKAYLLPKICPEKIKSIEVIEGDWKTVGSVKLWTFVAEKSESGKEKVEAIDEQNKSIAFKACGGEMMKYYKILKSRLEVTTKGEGSLVKWTLEYEKQNEDVPDPTHYVDLLANITKQIDAYLL